MGFSGFKAREAWGGGTYDEVSNLVCLGDHRHQEPDCVCAQAYQAGQDEAVACTDRRDALLATRCQWPDWAISLSIITYSHKDDSDFVQVFM